jgi:hypothetical protein
MNLPRFTADVAVYQTTNVYREFGHAAGFAHVATPNSEAMAVPAAGPVRVIPCHPPDCETCCYVDTVYSGGYQTEVYACANLKTSDRNCGTCGHSCGSGEVCCQWACVNTTSANYDCEQCGCAGSGEVCCNGACVNTTSANYNCEQCGCAKGMTCQNGSCQCPSGQTLCNGFCTNLSSDRQNCGSCGNICPDVDNTICQNGVCQCFGSGAGDIICNGFCTNPVRDSKNCGGCGNVCPKGTCCSFGACLATNVLRDPNNCGTCGNICYLSQCCSDGICADLYNDPNNCGTCGNVCANGCCSGGNCANLQIDPLNCGTCYNACGPGQTCVNGRCIAPPVCDDGSYATPCSSPSGWCCYNYCLGVQNECFNQCLTDYPGDDYGDQLGRSFCDQACIAGYNVCQQTGLHCPGPNGSGQGWPECPSSELKLQPRLRFFDKPEIDRSNIGLRSTSLRLSVGSTTQKRKSAHSIRKTLAGVISLPGTKP